MRAKIHYYFESTKYYPKKDYPIWIILGNSAGGEFTIVEEGLAYASVAVFVEFLEVVKVDIVLNAFPDIMCGVGFFPQHAIYSEENIAGIYEIPNSSR